MDKKTLKNFETKYMKKSLPNVTVGDTIEVTTMIRDVKGEKRRSQVFRGLVIADKGEGIAKTITVRKISGGVGVEKIIPIHSPNTEEIVIIKKGKVRQSKIYYMRGRIGRSAMKVSDSDEAIGTVTYVEEDETPVEEVVENNETEEDTKEEEVVEDKEEKPEEEKKEVEEEKKEEKKEEKTE